MKSAQEWMNSPNALSNGWEGSEEFALAIQADALESVAEWLDERRVSYRRKAAKFDTDLNLQRSIGFEEAENYVRSEASKLREKKA